MPSEQTHTPTNTHSEPEVDHKQSSTAATRSCLLSIIVVTYNTVEMTIACLRSIQRSIEAAALDPATIEIIIVDNASSDTSVAECTLFLRHSEIAGKVLGNVVNGGFAAGNNQGILAAQGSYIMLLNSDTIVGKSTIQQLVSILKSEEELPAVLAASLRNVDGSYQPQGGDLPSILSLTCFAFMLDDLPVIGRFLPSIQHTGRRAKPPVKQFQPKGWIAGTAMLFPSSITTSVGLLDEAIFMYAEDVEFCWRAKKAGYLAGELKDVQIVHIGSATAGANAAIQGEFASLLYVCRKHLPKWQQPIVKFLLKTAIFIRVVVFKLVGQKERSRILAEIKL